MIKKKPRTLLIHLKRFKIDQNTMRYQKLGHRIPFPSELRIESALDESDASTMYHLKGIVVHLGQGYAYGHYFAIIKSRGRWIKFDDNYVETVDEKFMKALFGSQSASYSNGGGSTYSMNEGNSWPTAYMLLYDSDK